MNVSSVQLLSVMFMIISSALILVDIYRKLQYTHIRSMRAFICFPILVMVVLTLLCVVELVHRHIRFIWS